MNIKLHFTLVGKTKYLRPSNSSIEWTNKDTFENVKKIVTNYFGDRALCIVNEKFLINNNITYPNCYSAGWFLDDKCESELVVLAHGENMRDANQSVIEYIKTVNWRSLSVKI